MATIKKFEDLEIWQEARRLSKEIHRISVETGLKTDFRLRDQIKASSGSVWIISPKGLKEMEIQSSGSFCLSQKGQLVRQGLNCTDCLIVAI